MKKVCAVLLLVGVVFCGSAMATPIEVGTGVNAANVVINWNDGGVAEFVVKFGTQSTDTVSGLDLFDIIQTGSTLTTVRGDFGFGVYVDGISFNSHSNIGYDGGENWWHYWVNDGTGWSSPGYGASSRAAANGFSDGWVYGNANAPVPEPITIALLGVGAVAMFRRKK